MQKLQPDINALKTWEEANKAKIQKVLSAYETDAILSLLSKMPGIKREYSLVISME